MVKGKSTGIRIRKSAFKGGAVPSCIQSQLRLVTVELRCALSAIAVATHALREQNSDLDSDIAQVLQRAAGAPLHAGVEKIDALLLELEGKAEAGGNPANKCVH